MNFVIGGGGCAQETQLKEVKGAEVILDGNNPVMDMLVGLEGGRLFLMYAPDRHTRERSPICCPSSSGHTKYTWIANIHFLEQQQYN